MGGAVLLGNRFRSTAAPCQASHQKPRRSRGFWCSVQRSLLQRPEPVVHILVDLILCKAVALLQLAFKLLAAALDHVEIVIGELAPFFLGSSFELLPVPFDPVPVHRDFSN